MAGNRARAMARDQMNRRLRPDECFELAAGLPARRRVVPGQMLRQWVRSLAFGQSRFVPGGVGDQEIFFTTASKAQADLPHGVTRQRHGAQAAVVEEIPGLRETLCRASSALSQRTDARGEIFRQ